MYGDGKTTDKPDVAGQWAGALRNGDRVELRKRVQAALEQLKVDSHVDTGELPPSDIALAAQRFLNWCAAVRM